MGIALSVIVEEERTHFSRDLGMAEGECGGVGVLMFALRRSTKSSRRSSLLTAGTVSSSTGGRIGSGLAWMDVVVDSLETGFSGLTSTEEVRGRGSSLSRKSSGMSTIAGLGESGGISKIDALEIVESGGRAKSDAEGLDESGGNWKIEGRGLI